MVPAGVTVLARMPLNENGKLDRDRLPAPVRVAATQPPVSATERTLARLWAELLSIPETDVGRDTDFFAVGGDSLLMIRLTSRIGERFATVPELRRLYEASDLMAMAATIDEVIARAANQEVLEW
ncbi:hypothetical protein CO641_14535 [Lysobacteraceae bacterium NML91-0213]|nr:hypothetical protein CO641_14535 [Xanthomonadaceae bacterium NML91-0213]